MPKPYSASPHFEVSKLQAFAKKLAADGMSGPLRSTGAAGRFFWIGSSFKKWICISCPEHVFDQALARSCGVAGSTWPWAHAATASGLWGQALFSAAFDEASQPELLDLWKIRSTPENAFSMMRLRDSTRFFACGSSQVEALSAALFRALPGSTLGACTAVDLPLFDQLVLQTPVFEPKLLDLMDVPYFEREDASSGLSEIQVDGLGRAWVLWLLGAARAMGCPAELSVSPRAMRELLAFGDILGAANKIAAETPLVFEQQFSAAIFPYTDLRPVYWPGLCDVITARDRRSIIDACMPAPNGAKNPSPRL